MPRQPRPKPGDIGWVDLTVPDATAIRDFYATIVGWKPESVDMKDYRDFNMTHPETGTPVAGVCHRRGTNVDLPATWMIYIVVNDLKTSLDKVAALGGRVVRPPKSLGPEGGFAVIEDPAGAVCALYQTPA